MRDFAQNFANTYKYGYQGSEKDDEVSGGGNSYTTEFRQLDPRLGRWFSVDPIFQPWQSPYTSMDNNPIGLNDPKGLKAAGGEATFSDGTVMKKPSKGNWFKRAGESMKNFFKESVANIKKSVISTFTFKQKMGAKEGEVKYVDENEHVHLETIHIKKRSWLAKTMSKVWNFFENARGGIAGYSSTGGDDADKNDAFLGTTKRKAVDKKDDVVQMVNFDEMVSLAGGAGTSWSKPSNNLANKKSFLTKMIEGIEVFKMGFTGGDFAEGITDAAKRVNTSELKVPNSSSVQDKILRTEADIHEQETWGGGVMHGLDGNPLKLGDTIMKRLYHESGKIDTIIPKNK